MASRDVGEVSLATRPGVSWDLPFLTLHSCHEASRRSCTTKESDSRPRSPHFVPSLRTTCMARMMPAKSKFVEC